MALNTIKNLANNAFRKFGYRVQKVSKFPIEATPKEMEIYELVKSHTMTGTERVFVLLKAVQYIVKNNIHGDFVECGVWRGGSSMAMAHMLNELGIVDKSLYLFDTFSGMTEPNENDIEIKSGLKADFLLKKTSMIDDENIWCIAGYDVVRRNMHSTGYPENRVKLVKGDILQTLKSNAPESISLLRLDTDWYESTKHELEILYPKLVSGGICIIDDYGHWAGSKKAVDEYFKNNDINALLLPIDDSGRIFIKR